MENAPLALTPVHTCRPEEGSGSVQPPSPRLQTAKSVSRRGPPAKSATFPNANHSAVKAAESAVQHTKPHQISDEHSSPEISFWGSGRLESIEESMQPGTPTSGRTTDTLWEQQPNSSWSLKMSHCKPLRIARQHSGSDASTSRTPDDVSTPCSPKASPKIMVVCRICEEQASTEPMLLTRCKFEHADSHCTDWKLAFFHSHEYCTLSNSRQSPLLQHIKFCIMSVLERCVTT